MEKENRLLELSLRDSEMRYRRLFEAAQDGILILDAKTGMIEDVNPYLIKMLGYSREEFVEKRLWEVSAFRDIQASKEAFEILQDRAYIRYEDLPLITKDGKLIQVEFVSNVYLAGDEKVIQCNIRDNTEHKRIIAALQANEKKYRDLINQSPDGYFIIELSGNILFVNKAMCKELEFSEEEFLSMNIWEIIPEQYLDQYRERLTKILTGESLKEAAEYEVCGKNGGTHYVEVLSAPRYSGRDIIGFQGIARDITARKRTEEALRVSEHRFKMASWATKDVIWERNFSANTISWNDSMQKLFHYTAGEIEPTVDWWQDHIHPAERVMVMASIQAAIVQEENFWSKEYRFRLPDGSYADVFDRGYISYNEQGQPLQFIGAMVDVTEQKQAEKALRSSEEKYRTLVMHLPTVIYTNPLDDAGSTLYVSPQIESLLGYTPQEWLANPKLWSKAVHPEDRPEVLKQTSLANKSKEPFEMNYRMTARDGRLVWVHDRLTLVNDLEGKPQYWQGIMLDITASKQAEGKIQQQIERLAVLNEIDRAIAFSFDPHLSLEILLTHIITYLNVDAADILVFNPDLQLLEYFAGRGFRTNALELVYPLGFGENFAGRIAFERNAIHIPDLTAKDDNPRLAQALKNEKFTSYYGIPLISKGKLKGVLEVFHRATLEPDRDRLEFLHTLAGQAAIAIENFMLFDGLQRSNSELMLAYETTLEGWSRALDLRDKETEGHTQRVTEMTVKLARSFGLNEAELLNVRRGGLLHDIGKMGVPDHILLKPGELTKEEWQLMRMHPVYAYDLLSHIAYLKEALDIPYCHHEKWDGSGYPRGLKGEQIPLTARIFAVVDVWDALTSDRPYRAAWTEEKALEYIRASAGAHFDPQVVAAFMQVNGGRSMAS
ncbi:MAG: PAS domain S-box protein [Anaerolineales bacterium]|nr:PAS domain S-box protein [Anaerolineales bacterium]